MRVHAALAAICLLVIGSDAAVAASAEVAEIVLHPPVRISPPGVGPHVWWMIDASAMEPGRLVVCGMRFPLAKGGVMEGVLYGSSDGGDTWQTLLTDSGDVIVSEVACALGRNKTVYFVSSHNGQPDVSSMHLRRSVDFGTTWGEAIRGKHADAARLLVQPGVHPDQDRVLLVEDGYGAVRVSEDGGRTLSKEIRLPKAPVRPAEAGFNWLGGVTQLPDGTVGALMIERPLLPSERKSTHESWETFFRIRPDGTAAAPPSVVGQLSTEVRGFFPRLGESEVHSMRWGGIANGVLPKTNKNRIYATWHDLRDGQFHILLATSDDEGLTWTSPRAIDDAPDPGPAVEGRDRIVSHPSIAVTRSGVVGVLWLEFNGRCWRFAASLDGGETFSASKPVNTCAMRSAVAAPLLNGYLLSDSYRVRVGTQSYLRAELVAESQKWSIKRGPMLTAAADSTFSAAWVANGDGEDALFLSRISVQNDSRVRYREQVVSRFASGGYIRDSTAELDYTDLRYDPQAGEFTLSVVVGQLKAAPRSWPLILKLHRLGTRLGAVLAEGADNGVTAQGASWVFEGPAAALPPGSRADLRHRSPYRAGYEFSKPRILRFRLQGPAHADSLDDLRSGQGLLQLDFEVYRVP